MPKISYRNIFIIFHFVNSSEVYINRSNVERMFSNHRKIIKIKLRSHTADSSRENLTEKWNFLQYSFSLSSFPHHQHKFFRTVSMNGIWLFDFLIQFLLYLVRVRAFSVWDRILQRLLDRLREPLNRQIINAIESQRVNFPVGWPMLGIPPIEPLFIAEFEYQSPEIGNLAKWV